MSGVIDYWGDLGATAGQGVADYATMMREMENQARARKIQEDALRRTTALQDHQFAMEEAQRLRAGGNLPGAHSATQRALQAANTFDGGDRVGPKYIGTYGTAEGPRPDPAMQGPMPSVTTYDPTRPDWANKANSRTLDAVMGFKAPKPELVKIGRSVGHYDENGKFVVDHTEDDPMAAYRKETLELRRDEAEARERDRRDRAADRDADRAERAARGGKGSGKRGGYDDTDPQDVAALETKLLKQAQEQAKLSMTYPVDKVGRGRGAKALRPDGIADGMGIPIGEAKQAYNLGVNTIYQRLRAKHGFKTEE